MDPISVIITIASLSVGAFLGVLGNRLIVSTEKSNLHYFFYGFCILSLIATITIVFINLQTFLHSDLTGLISAIVAIVFSVLLFLFTKRYLAQSYIYETRELDPIINNFTNSADANRIRLFAGDLNFFGNNPNEMNGNAQYICLRQAEFDHVYILCSKPNQPLDMIRYGKILHDLPQTELRFYESEDADLQIRGRMKELQGVTKLLMYSKVAPHRYKAIEIDTADSHGALYNNIWQLLWSSARIPTHEDLEEYNHYLTGH